MLKSDLINILVVKRGVTQKQAELTIETIFDSMKGALCKGENIEIRGLGAFHVKHYDGYQGRNPSMHPTPRSPSTARRASTSATARPSISAATCESVARSISSPTTSTIT